MSLSASSTAPSIASAPFLYQLSARQKTRVVQLGASYLPTRPSFYGPAFPFSLTQECSYGSTLSYYPEKQPSSHGTTWPSSPPLFHTASHLFPTTQRNRLPPISGPAAPFSLSHQGCSYVSTLSYPEKRPSSHRTAWPSSPPLFHPASHLFSTTQQRNRLPPFSGPAVRFYLPTRGAAMVPLSLLPSSVFKFN